MKNALIDRVAGSGKVSTIIGTVLAAAITGAAQYFASTGNTTDWKPYAGAAAVAATGVLWKRKS